MDTVVTVNKNTAFVTTHSYIKYTVGNFALANLKE